MLVSNTVQSYSTNTQFEIKQYINCNSRNVIYVISFIQCRKQYVGHTFQNLKCRIRKHISDIAHASASFHFASVHGGFIEFLKAQGIERVYPPIRGEEMILSHNHLRTQSIKRVNSPKK